MRELRKRVELKTTFDIGKRLWGSLLISGRQCKQSHTNGNKAMRGMCDSHLTTWQTQQTAIMFLSVWTVISDIQDRQDGLARGIPWHEQDNVIENPSMTNNTFCRTFFLFLSTDWHNRSLKGLGHGVKSGLCLRLDKFAYSSWIFIRIKSSE